jgi:hypothetical protein
MCAGVGPQPLIMEANGDLRPDLLGIPRTNTNAVQADQPAERSIRPPLLQCAPGNLYHQGLIVADTESSITWCIRGAGADCLFVYSLTNSRVRHGRGGGGRRGGGLLLGQPAAAVAERLPGRAQGRPAPRRDRSVIVMVQLRGCLAGVQACVGGNGCDWGLVRGGGGARERGGGARERGVGAG